jgi:hypothetical protein
LPGCKVTAATLSCPACYAHGRSVTAVSIATGEALAAVRDPQTVAVTLLNPPPAVVKAWAVAVTHDGTKAWVACVAGAWNGSGAHGSYAAAVQGYYQTLYNTYVTSAAQHPNPSCRTETSPASSSSTPSEGTP